MIAIFRLLYRQPCSAAEDLCHQAAMSGVKMLDYCDRRWKVFGESRQYLAQRRESSCRRGEGHDIKSGFFCIEYDGGFINFGHITAHSMTDEG